MAQVYIPPQMRDLTGGQTEVQVSAQNVRQVIEALERLYPGIQARLMDEHRLNPHLAVAVDNVVSSRGLLAPVQAQSLVHFVPAFGGG